MFCDESKQGLKIQEMTAILVWQNRDLLTRINYVSRDLPHMACLAVHNMFGHDLISAVQLHYQLME
jgi:hypothetical protein